MARRNISLWGTHTKLRDETVNLQKSLRDKLDLDLSLKKCSLLMAEKARRGKIDDDEILSLISEDGRI